MKKPPGPSDNGKSVFVPPATQQPPGPATQTPEASPRPPLLLTFTQQRVRVGEEAKFTLSLPVVRMDQVQRVPPVDIDFGDGTSASGVDITASAISHRYAEKRSYDVRAYFTDRRSRRLPPIPVSNTVTVQVEGWSLTPPAAEVEVGDPVTFKIDGPPDDASFTFLFHFGEEPETSTWDKSPEGTYSYHSTGKFSPRADVRVIDGSREIVASTDAIEIVVQPLPRNALLLDVTPGSIQVGGEVVFTATFNSKFDANDKNIGFRFFFGDGTSSEWAGDRTIRRSYSVPGDYQAQVAVGWLNARTKFYAEMTRSEFRAVNVTTQRAPSIENPSTEPPRVPRPGGSDLPPYLIYVLAGLIVIAVSLLFASYKTWRSYYAVRPEYVARADAGSAEADHGRLTLDVEMQFTRNERESRYQLQPTAAGLIRFERITHD